MIERQPDGQLLHLGVDNLRQRRAETFQLVDLFTEKEHSLIAELEKVSGARRFLIREGNKFPRIRS